MKTIIKHRWKIIFGALVIIYLLFVIKLFLAQLGENEVIHVCPPEVSSPYLESSFGEPNFKSCKPIEQKIGAEEILFVIIFPLIVGTFGIPVIFPILGLFALDRLWKAKKYTLALIILACSLCITFLRISLNFPKTALSLNELNNVQFGLPIPFIAQNQHYSPEQFPYPAHFSSVLENPTIILWPQLIISFLIVFIFTFLFLKGLVWIFISRR